jgi:competence protein ComGC
MAYRKKNSNSKPQKRGFTLVEMLIVAPIVILVIGIFVSLIVTMTGSVLASRGENTLSYSINDAMTRIDQDVKASAGFLSTNSITLTTGQGIDNGTAIFENATGSGATNPELILNSYATDQNPLTPTRNIIDAANSPYACGTQYVSQNQTLMTNVVYFVQNGSLWRRVIMPSNYAAGGCATPWQKPTCTPGYSAAFCKTNDQDLVDGVTAFSVTYWTNSVPPTQVTTASDYTQTDSTRQTAMLTANSVYVTITAAKTLSGRSVSQSGSVRSTGVQVPTMLTQPTSQTVTSGNNATFTTVAFGTNMTEKWEQSVDNGVTWTAVSGATSPVLTVTSVAGTQDGTLYHVIYTNSYGQVTSSPARLTVNSSGWTALTFQNSWANYSGSYASGAYLKTSSGIVMLNGMLTRTGSPVAGEVIATLPPGYRPSVPLVFGICTSASVAGRVDVYPNGNILFEYGSATWLSLQNINFVADTGRYVSTPITQFYNGWVNYGTSGWGNVSYVVDSMGRVDLQGLLAVPTSGLTNYERIYDLPANLLPSGFMYLPSVTAGGAFASYAIQPSLGSSAVVYRMTGSSYLPTNTIYYPAVTTPTPTWTTLTFSNSWVAYGGAYSTPQYTKASDGMVSLKGLIKSGTMTSDTVIATLPAGYRPALREVFLGYSDGGVARFDVEPSGNITYEAGGNGWFSLDGASFYADQ